SLLSFGKRFASVGRIIFNGWTGVRTSRIGRARFGGAWWVIKRTRTLISEMATPCEGRNFFQQVFHEGRFVCRLTLRTRFRSSRVTHRLGEILREKLPPGSLFEFI